MNIYKNLRELNLSPNLLSSSQNSQKLSILPKEINLLNLNNLPHDIIKEIMKKLEDNDIISLCKVNRKLRDICENQDFWRERRLVTYENFFPPHLVYFCEERGIEKKKYFIMKLLTIMASIRKITVENLCKDIDHITIPFS